MKPNKYSDKEEDESISSDEFVEIMSKVRQHRLEKLASSDEE